MWLGASIKHHASSQDLHPKLDYIWGARDFFTTQMTNQTMAKFKYAPAYSDRETVRWVNWSAERLVRFWDFPGLQQFDDILFWMEVWGSL